MQAPGSKDISRVALLMALSKNRDEESKIKEEMRQINISTAAVDYGGEFISSVTKIIERTVVASKREGIISDTHAEEGAVAGATREAIAQIMPKAIGLNVGGKIGIARFGDHICVAIFFEIGMLHLNEVSVGLGHRAI
ncbi:MAG TPA: HutP family protein [Clostridiales bacterium]|nr:HutP family protein [Candidatus Atribacteria bacterium]HPT79460.1 HutP family protein [Candidatus Atribacteria bacterium]HPZ06016.1 HutP family protein [Clostridiales bacterium]